VFRTRAAGKDWEDSERAPLAISVHEVDITPHPGAGSGWMAGYGWSKRANPDFSFARELTAQCAVIWTEGTPNVLLRADVAGIPREVHWAIRQQVLDAVPGLITKNFLLASSHTHSGPFIGDTHPSPQTLINADDTDIAAINAFTNHFVDQMVKTVRNAAETPPVSVRLSYAFGTADIARNRTGLPWCPTEVPVLIAESTIDGSLQAVLFGYACHPVSRGRDEVFDSDYCGYACEHAEKRLDGVPVLFFQGTAGDIDPDVDEEARGVHAVEELGKALGDAVVDIINNASFTQVTGPMHNHLEEIELPLALDTEDPHILTELQEKYHKRVESLPNDESPAGAAHRHAAIMLEQIEEGTLPRSVPMPIQRFRFNGLSILALAHEVCSGYQMAVQNAYTQSPLWIMAYANEVSCYVPGDDLLWRGGYEAGWEDGDPRIAGISTNLIVYPWPVPLRASGGPTMREVGDRADDDSVEGILTKACLDILSD
jgi:hypothetical protein